jgi:hypothetical protein
MLRSVDYQIVETVNVEELSQCNFDDPLNDARAGRMLCEILYATKIVQPTFGHSLGNTWLTRFPATGNGSIDSCTYSTAPGWRECVSKNVAKQTTLLLARAPHLLFSAGLMEFLHRANLDNSSVFKQCCIANTIGQWGNNETCVPDVRTRCVQDYYTSWGKVYLDAGIRAFFFGQARLTGGGRSCNNDGTGCSRVSVEGAAGFFNVINRLQSYAEIKGYGDIFFGPQAASGFELANGTEAAHWAYGAQHLFARDGWLVQPFGINGTAPPRSVQWYGAGDLHDANRLNNANRLPVLVDFDNFSDEEDKPDDIRRLSSWSNNTRSQFVKTLWHTMRAYNSRVTVSIPLSKAAGGNWPEFQQSQCWSGRTLGSADGIYFGGVSCGLLNVTKEIFLGPDTYSVSQVLRSVDPFHFGKALQSPDLTAVWGVQTLLRRDFVNIEEYKSTLQTLPSILLGARGARGKFATQLIESDEFQKSECANNMTCVGERLQQFLCLGMAECAVLATIQSWKVRIVNNDDGDDDDDDDGVNLLCDAADRLNLFGNAALIDPTWCVGC